MQYAILNTVDRPDRRMVVEIIEGKAYYMSRAEEPRMKSYDGMTLRPDTTSLEDFGFTIVDLGRKIRCVKTGPGVAKYRDGEPRKWQGADDFELPKVAL